MKAANVIRRFLSLLDVALLLLGLLMVTLTQTQLQAEKEAGEQAQLAADLSLARAAGLDFVYLLAGTSGAESGHCFLLGPDRQPIREIRTDRPDDLQWELTRQAAGRMGQTAIVMLVVSDKGFDSMWSAARLAQMERTWGVKIVPLYNTRLDELTPGARL